MTHLIGLTAIDRLLLAHAEAARGYRHDELIYAQSEKPAGIYLTKSGAVLLEHHDPLGHVMAFRVTVPGYYFRFHGYFSNIAHATSA